MPKLEKVCSQDIICTVLFFYFVPWNQKFYKFFPMGLGPKKYPKELFCIGGWGYCWKKRKPAKRFLVDIF